MPRKNRKSKAQVEYERARKNLGQYIRRMEKAGSIYYADLPETLRKQKGRGAKISAREYRQATKEIKALWDQLKEKRTKERTFETLDNEYARLIQEWVDEVLNMSSNEGRGAMLITDTVIRWTTGSEYSAKDIAGAINTMTAAGVVISWPVYYNPDQAGLFLSSMEQYILQEQWASSWEMEDFERQYEDLELDYVDYELQ